jgi:hypothetical protein
LGAVCRKSAGDAYYDDVLPRAEVSTKRSSGSDGRGLRWSTSAFVRPQRQRFGKG